MARPTEDEKDYLPKRQRPEAESRLIALMLISRLPEAADTFLLRCCAEGELLSYFELMPALSRLTQEGQAVRRAEGTAWRYHLTDAGEETLALFTARVPGSDRDRIEALLPAWQEELRLQREFAAQMTRLPRGEYEVTLSVMEQGAPILTLTAPVPSAELAARMKDRWEACGAQVYGQIIRLMTGEDEP